jgi:hypothetical protein
MPDMSIVVGLPDSVKGRQKSLETEGFADKTPIRLQKGLRKRYNRRRIVSRAYLSRCSKGDADTL